MSASLKSWVIIVGLVLLFAGSNPTCGSSIDRLENLAESDIIPEVREAASKALVEKYIDQKISSTRLISVVNEARTHQLKNAAIKALAKTYEDARRLESLEEALEKARKLEEKAKGGESPEARAASSALAFYYLAFNVNHLKGYSMTELEDTATEAANVHLREAAASALEFVYPNHYSEGELIDLMNSTPYELIKQAAAGALAIRYSTQMPPNPGLETLSEIASSEQENRWLREAAGRAYGRLAPGQVDPGRLEKLALRGKTAEIQSGAADAWEKHLINSSKSKLDLLKMACSATGFAPNPYGSAVAGALADRLSESDFRIQEG